MMSNQQIPTPAGQPRYTGRRRVDLLLTGLTCVLFMAFLWFVIGSPGAFAPQTVIALGFGLIVYSVVATWLYQLWIEAGEGRGGQP